MGHCGACGDMAVVKDVREMYRTWLLVQIYLTDTAALTAVSVIGQR